MRRRILRRTALAVAAIARPRRAVLITTDAEGVAGICRQSLTETTKPESRRAAR